MKILPVGKPFLDSLSLLKTKINIIRKSLGHPEVQKLYIIKYQVLLSKTTPNISKNAIFDFWWFFKNNFAPGTLPEKCGVEDKGQGFSKKLFYCSKSITAATAANLRKTAVLTLS